MGDRVLRQPDVVVAVNAIDMIRRCHKHQNPADYQRPFIPDPTSGELEPVWSHDREVLQSTELFTEQCARCGCSHGPPAWAPETL